MALARSIPDLARIIAAWATLPADVKAGVVAMVQAATARGENR
jgi:hypothetical protein